MKQKKVVYGTWAETQLRSIHPCTKCGMGGNLGTVCQCDRPGRKFTSPVRRYFTLPNTEIANSIRGVGVCKRKHKTNPANGSMPARGRPPKKEHGQPHPNPTEQEAFNSLFAADLSATLTQEDNDRICKIAEKLQEQINDLAAVDLVEDMKNW